MNSSPVVVNSTEPSTFSTRKHTTVKRRRPRVGLQCESPGLTTHQPRTNSPPWIGKIREDETSLQFTSHSHRHVYIYV